MRLMLPNILTVAIAAGVLLLLVVWFKRKRLSYLEAPGTSELVIGVKNPEPWRKVFGPSLGKA